jgi:hypothetical protein
VPHSEYSSSCPARGSRVGSTRLTGSRTPSQPVILEWETFGERVDEAGMAQRYGGTQFKRADLSGRQAGKLVAGCVWEKAQSCVCGTNLEGLLLLSRTTHKVSKVSDVTLGLA